MYTNGTAFSHYYNTGSPLRLTSIDWLDCKRHWEAIGLGAIPITQLNPDVYGFVKGAVFDYHGPWNETEIPNILEYKAPDQTVVFEEYWMLRMEEIVGRELGWNRTDWREWI